MSRALEISFVHNKERTVLTGPHSCSPIKSCRPLPTGAWFRPPMAHRRRRPASSPSPLAASAWSTEISARLRSTHFARRLLPPAAPLTRLRATSCSAFCCREAEVDGRVLAGNPLCTGLTAMSAFGQPLQRLRTNRLCTDNECRAGNLSVTKQEVAGLRTSQERTHHPDNSQGKSGRSC
jgi:hypothetical protein